MIRYLLADHAWSACLRICLLTLLVLLPASSWAEDALFQLKPNSSTQHMRQMQDPTLSALLDLKSSQAIHLAHANTALLTDHTHTLQIDLGDGHTVSVHKTMVENLPSGFSVWHGEIATPERRALTHTEHEVPNDEANSVILVRHGNRITGSIHFHGQPYKVLPLKNGEHAIVQVDESKLPIDTNDAVPSGEVPRKESSTSMHRSRDGISTIRVLTTASIEAIARIGEEGDDFEATVTLAIAESNQGFVNSGAPIRFENAGAIPLDFHQPAGATTGTLLDMLKNPNDPSLGTPVMHLRDQYRADVAVLLVTSLSDNVCGRATLNASKATAYSVDTWWCATGSTYTFAHEIGHNLGALHNTGETGAAFPYGYGYRQTGHSPYWRTIMSAACAGVTCNAINYWSSPSRTYNGLPMGEEGRSDNVRLLEERGPVVAAFYPDPGSAVPPKAVATASPSTVTAATQVSLNGSQSSNPDGGSLHYQWVQTGGAPAVDITDSSSAQATASIPAVSQDTTFHFRLTVSNSDALSDSAEANVTAKAGGGGGGGCDGIPAWVADKTYSTYGEQVSHLGKIYRQNFHSINQPPDQHSAPYGEPWVYIKDCGGSASPARLKFLTVPTPPAN